MINKAILGVISGARISPPGPSYFTYLAIGFTSSPYYRIVDSTYANIGAPAAAREVYGFSYDKDRSNVMIHSVTGSNSQFLNIGSLTLSNPGTALPANPRGSSYVEALDAFICGTQNTPRATRYNASDFTKHSNLDSQPGSNVTFVEKSPDGLFVGMALESGNRHILYNIPSLTVVAFSGTNLGSTAATITFDKDSSLFALSTTGAEKTRVYTTSGADASVATFASTGTNNCSVFHPSATHIFIGTSDAGVNYGQVFDYTTGSLVTNLSTSVGSAIEKASYSSDGALLAVSHGNDYSVFETTGYTRVHGPTSVGSGILSLRFLEAVD